MKSWIKQVVKALLKKSGYEIYPSQYIKYLEKQSFAYHLQQLFQKLDIHCVLDVGANTGRYRDFLRQAVGYEGLIISFEPVKKNVDILTQKASKDKNWLIYDFALGSQETSQEINVMKADVFSSFLNPDHSIVDQFQQENRLDYQEIVAIKTLDSVMNLLKKQHSIKNVYLKMDTQGYDLEVINGAGESIPDILALQTEVSMRKIYEEMPTFLDMYQTLIDEGFEITGMFPVNRDPWLRAIEFDCVMLNSNLANR